MNRAYNFCAGPATLPTEVMQQVQEELLDWHGSGVSIMEMSHRSKQFTGVLEQAQQDVKDLLNIPDNYHVLFLHGGATSQFSMIPLNLLKDSQSADYVRTGTWSSKAIKEAQRYTDVKIIVDSQPNKFTTVVSPDQWEFNSNAAYCHYCPNETIHGLEIQTVPNSPSPLVADMSSTIFSRPIDVSKFGVIYAGAQKNIGPAGVTLVIIRDDLVGNALEFTPGMFDYKNHVENQCCFNTAPTFPIYVSGLVFQWIKKQGGLEKMAQINKNKSQKLYDFIDNSQLYSNPVDKNYRSWMNIPFIVNQEDLLDKFLKQADASGLVALKGHRSVGGCRASIYNAMPEAGVDGLIEFMTDFEKRVA